MTDYRDFITPAADQVEIHGTPELFLSSFASVPQAVGDLFAAHWLMSEVRNGAFPQFFSNSTGVLAPEALEALKRLGLSKAAKALEAAMFFFGESYPRDRGVRQEMIDWVWNEEITEVEEHNLDILLDLSEQFLDALGRDQHDFIQAANAYAGEHDGSA